VHQVERAELRLQVFPVGAVLEAAAPVVAEEAQRRAGLGRRALPAAAGRERHLFPDVPGTLFHE